jgi:hypothetical protein
VLPGGGYTIDYSARSGDGDEMFCIEIDFTL